MDIFLGVDGGGTKTEAAAIDSHGKVLSRYSGSSTNPYVVTFDGAMQELSNVLNRVVEPLSLSLSDVAIKGICLGMSGVSTSEEKDNVISFLRSYQQQHDHSFPISITTEAEISLMASLEREYGILVISGTGSNTYGITQKGKRYRVGGWGHILGDEGSGYQIGLLTLKTVIKSLEGMLPATLMSQRITDAYNFGHISELKSYVYQSSIGRNDIAAFARYCVEAAKDGDDLAQGILRDQAVELAETTTALIGRDSELTETEVVCTGSIFNHSAIFRDAFRETLLSRFPGLSFMEGKNDLTPADGAALLSRKLYSEKV
ncbi:BadF-type ATPase [Paenibacillus uliginis N3/975]|uniref:BadF-type ATPase n=1 Tax=Paenibacillus uliginis N3/975 TaxID=1313296 RepID=A0A1X7GHK1_9BACL|nr:BadF/BadG/BcrA/BcrD ATPase family protein [Paenibacillus uliginis]SMF69893.1 BadF-type ATPase [Paenibacillus uliginis N3/975]